MKWFGQLFPAAIVLGALYAYLTAFAPQINRPPPQDPTPPKWDGGTQELQHQHSRTRTQYAR